jgi:large subunit ribosomal protein L24e
MPKCSFCGNNLKLGTGEMFVKKEGAIFFFCSSKCKHNLLDLGRSPHKTLWTLTHAKEKELEQKGKKKK